MKITSHNTMRRSPATKLVVVGDRRVLPLTWL